MKNAVQRFGKFLSSMVMPNIGAFIAWGFITALFIEKGWLPNAQLATLNGPMLNYLLPVLIAFQGGKLIGGDRGGEAAEPGRGRGLCLLHRRYRPEAPCGEGPGRRAPHRP